MLTLAPALALSLHAIFAKPQIILAAASPEPPGPAQRGPDFGSVFAQTRHPEAGLPTQDASSDLRPALLHKSGKLEAIEGAGHVDVSQHSGDFGSPTKHVEGLVSVLRLRNPEPGFTQDIDLNNPH